LILSKRSESKIQLLSRLWQKLNRKSLRFLRTRRALNKNRRRCKKLIWPSPQHCTWSKAEIAPCPLRRLLSTKSPARASKKASLGGSHSNKRSCLFSITNCGPED